MLSNEALYFLLDEMYDKAIEEIDKAILEIENNLEGKLSIVFPINGIGYGPYYQLNNNPKTKRIWEYLNDRLKNFMKEYQLKKIL